MKLLRKVISRIYTSTAYYAKVVSRKFVADDVLFYASSLSFQIVLCLIPTVLLITWVLGTILSQNTLLRQVEYVSYYALPHRIHSVDEFRQLLMSRTRLLMSHRSLFGFVGITGFFWTSLALISTLRKTVFHVLGIKMTVSFVRQTLYDLRVLLITGFFLTASTVVTALFTGVRKAALQLPPGQIRFALIRVAVPLLSGFGLTFLLYFSIYRFLSFGKLKSGAAAFGALWAAAFFEGAKNLFAVYLSGIGSLSRLYGTLEVVVGLLLWIFYSTCVFIVGVELSEARVNRKQQQSGPVISAAGAL